MESHWFSVAHLIFDAFTMLVGIIAFGYFFLDTRSKGWFEPTFILKMENKIHPLILVILANIWRLITIAIGVFIIVHFWTLSEAHIYSHLKSK
jgi:hypothetical protein